MSQPGSANQIGLRTIREVTQGVTPAGAMQQYFVESFSAAGPISREQPGNVRSDRQVPDNPANNIKVSGQAKSDYIHAAYQIWIESIMQGAMASPASVTATTISAVGATPAIHNTAAGSWSGFSDGDFALVSGFTTNPAVFLVHVNGAPATNDLTISSEFGAGGVALVNEAAGASITVQHAGRFRFGTTMLSQSVEEWSTQTSVGKIHKGLVATKFTLDLSYPNKLSMSWSFEGVSSKSIAAQLANTTTNWSGGPVINSNTNFGDAGVPTAGFGFRYGNQGASALMPTLRIKTLKVEIDNPVTAEGGAGTLGPIDVAADKRFNCKVTLNVFRDGSAAAEQIISDAENPSANLTMGFGFKDNNGKRQYMYFPYMQPSDEKTTGPKQDGREMGDITYNARIDGGVTGMFQWTQFN